MVVISCKVSARNPRTRWMAVAFSRVRTVYSIIYRGWNEEDDGVEWLVGSHRVWLA